jgi:CopG family transcriptional regulator/antitoxin EndoAI
MHRRLNVSLPEATVQLIDRVAKKGGRSRLIADAVHSYVARRSRAKLRKAITDGARRRAVRDLEIAQDWATLEDVE